MVDSIGYISLMLVAAVVSADRVGQDKQDIIKLDNICIAIRYGYEYKITSNTDYLQVNIEYGGARGHVYIGYNPQILDSNRKWASTALREKIKSPKIVSLEGSQAGQFLGVPAHEDDKYFHLWFEKDSGASTAPIREVVGFCRS